MARYEVVLLYQLRRVFQSLLFVSIAAASSSGIIPGERLGLLDPCLDLLVLGNLPLVNKRRVEGELNLLMEPRMVLRSSDVDLWAIMDRVKICLRARAEIETLHSIST